MNAVLLKSSLALEQLAEELWNVFERSPNMRPEGRELRESIDKGGLYYRFRLLGTSVDLLHNADDAEIADAPDYEYYLFVDDGDPHVRDSGTTRIRDLLHENGLDVAIGPY